MGRDIETTEFTREDRRVYREKVKANLAVLAQLVDSGRFATGGASMGVEMELYLTDRSGRAVPLNAQVLDALASADFQTELGKFNLEFALPPRKLVADCFTEVEDELRTSLERASAKAALFDARIMIIGILPTLTDFDVTEQNLSANPRYRAINDAILAVRGEDIVISIQGDEELDTLANSILFEAACTSFQLHLEVAPDDFGRFWNAAQVLSGPLVAVSANSPFFLGKLLHHETRIALFEQAADTRTEELASQGVRPRVWFGERWLTEGVFELFDENVRYFPSLLPITDDEDPHALFDAGDIPHLPELTLHNGTIYRWNRPVYDVARGRPHLRVENRVMPAGPTVIDATANAAFYYGLVRSLADADPPPWKELSFATAEQNFYTGARHGLDAHLFWPGVGPDVPVTDLLLRHLIPAARAGLEAWSVDSRDADRYLSIIEGRAASGQNGARWQIDAWHRLLDSGLDRQEAGRRLTLAYAGLAEGGTPVHTWPLPEAG